VVKTDDTHGIDGLWSPEGRQSHHRLAIRASWIILLLFALSAVFADLIAPYDPYRNNLVESLRGPSWNHLLGTDILGRDVLSRLIFGSRTALSIAMISILIASCLGAFLGLIAGYSGHLVNAIIMRFIDGIMCFPRLVWALFISMVLGGGIFGVIIALGLGSVAIHARLMNGLVLSIKEKDFIKAARSIGSSHIRILAVHILPNALPPIIIQATIGLSTIILAEAGLSFLGIGIKPPGASWGSMIADGYGYLETNPVIAFAPGMALMLVAFSFNTIGDVMRDWLDPRFMD
jgi:peptide/nickel transport system permease protein